MVAAPAKQSRTGRRKVGALLWAAKELVEAEKEASS
jgi:hypothetical protein